MKEGSLVDTLQSQATTIGSKVVNCVLESFSLDFNLDLSIFQVVDVSKRGWTDLSTLFNQKASLYSDPNSENNEYDYGTGDQGGSYQEGYKEDNCDYRNEGIGRKESSSLLSTSKSSPNVSQSSNNQSTGNATTVKTSNISKEEKTLINFGESSSNKKNSKKTEEDDFWELLNDSPKASSKKSSRRK